MGVTDSPTGWLGQGAGGGRPAGARAAGGRWARRTAFGGRRWGRGRGRGREWIGRQSYSSRANRMTCAIDCRGENDATLPALRAIGTTKIPKTWDGHVDFRPTDFSRQVKMTQPETTESDSGSVNPPNLRSWTRLANLAWVRSTTISREDAYFSDSPHSRWW